MPPALTVALAEAGVRTVGPLTRRPGFAVVGCMAADEAVAIATGAPTAHTAASAATRVVGFGMMRSSPIRTYKSKLTGTPRVEAP